MERIKYIHPKGTEGLIGLPDNFILPSHFLGVLIGKPGSGKTSLLKFLLKNESLLFKRFDFIFIITPSQIEFTDLFLPKENFNNELNFDW